MADFRLSFNCGSLILLGHRETEDQWVLWFENAAGKRVMMRKAFLRLYGYHDAKKYEKQYIKLWIDFEPDATELHMSDRQREQFTCHFATIPVKSDILCPCLDKTCTTCAPIVSRRLAAGRSTAWTQLF